MPRVTEQRWCYCVKALLHRFVIILLVNSAVDFKAGFPVSILVVGGALSPHLGGAPGVGDGGSNHRLVGEQPISAHVNIPTSKIALHTSAPLTIVSA